MAKREISTNSEDFSDLDRRLSRIEAGVVEIQDRQAPLIFRCLIIGAMLVAFIHLSNTTTRVREMHKKMGLS